MTNIPAGIAADQALAQQKVALSVIKKSAEAERGIANILQQSAETVSANTSRGQNVNILV